MSTKIGDLFFDVYADVSRAARNVDDLSGRFARAGAAASRAIGDTVANATAIATAGLAALTGATLNAGAAYNVLGQSATAAFTTIYDDVKIANDILQEVSELDLETPFRGASLVRTARTLAGFGVEAEDVLGITTALSEAIAGMGLGSAELQRVAVQFGQIQSRGRLAGDEARALANYGIDAFGILADQIGKPVAEIRRMSEELELTADVAIPALVKGMEERFGGATEALFNTAAGQAEGLRSVFEAVGSALVQPFVGFSGGGALVEAMDIIRVELTELVGVAEDGSFVLRGFLEPLTPLMQALADATLRGATAFAGFLGGLDSTSLYDLAERLEGLAPVIAGLGGLLATVFVQAIPFIGRFAAGFNPIVVGIAALVAASPPLREAVAGAFRDIWNAIKPIIPDAQELVETLIGIAEAAIPPALEAIVEATQDLAPAVEEAVEMTNDLLEVLGPTFVEFVKAAADILKILSDIVGVLPPEIVVLTAAVLGLSRAFPILTAAMALNASVAAVSAGGGGMALLATRFGLLGTAVVAAAAAYGSFKAVSAGLRGDMNWLNEDVGLLEKPWQMLGRATFAVFGGDRELVQQAAEMQAALDAGRIAGTDFAESMKDSGLSMAAFSDRLAEQGLEVEANNFALIRYREILDEIQAEHVAAARAVGALEAASNWEARFADSFGGVGNLADEVAEPIDLLDALREAADRAWEAVDQLLRPSAEVTIDDFLRELPDLARDVSDAMKQVSDAPGILSDLDLGGAEQAVRQQARDLISTMTQEYGLGIDQIKSMLEDRGLEAVIAQLGLVTEETAETVDPLVAQYSRLGATAEQLREAIGQLETARTTALRAQIDQVSAALDDAVLAAERARQAVVDFLSGGYVDSPQQLVDQLIGDVDSLGSAIEDAMRQGGVQGEAAIRLTLGDLNRQLAEIVNAGMEAGLGGADIVALIGPVAQAIQEQIQQAANRGVTLNWDEGFLATAGQQLLDALNSGMDPAAIQELINNILGADATVTGLEGQLEALQAALQTDVVFSEAQVQGALDDIATTTTVTPVITPEAAQAVYDAIMEELDAPGLEPTVNQALITQQLLDAAQAAEDEISLVFDSALSFDSEALHAVASAMSDEFYAAFQGRLRELRDERAQDEGFDSAFDMEQALGPVLANLILSGAAATPPAPNVTTEITNDITIEGSQTPEATASEVVAATSAAAVTGGRLNNDILLRYGNR